MIEVKGLTKRHDDVLAVDNLSFTVRPGTVTGFLGPNGAGKSSTMRMILGLNRPTAGTATVDGRPFVARQAGLHHVGALLDAGDVHPGHTAAAHCHFVSAAERLPPTHCGRLGSRTGHPLLGRGETFRNRGTAAPGAGQAALAAVVAWPQPGPGRSRLRWIVAYHRS
ncbi:MULTISPECIES: ATP-binding cassette domain-containing protein [unclassified Streptomyces]|uniref:ATP-binding cassette domain-containing protein n=1 Tax=unclassified Streptomyces TaxID=2593676 RepID=UPI003864088E